MKDTPKQIEEKDLPPLGKYVLIYTPSRPWSDPGDPSKGFLWKVAVRRALSDPAMQPNNRGASYMYKEFGPGSFWAHEVTRWEYLPSKEADSAPGVSK